VPVEYVVFDDEGHGFRKKENQQRGYSAVLAFLDRHLKATGAPPEPPAAAAEPTGATSGAAPVGVPATPSPEATADGGSPSVKP
jgi:prolyl oligopeptidase family protein